MQRRTKSQIVTAIVPIVFAVTFPSTALAHFSLLQPPAADNVNDGGKGAPPCGSTVASNIVTPVQGGHALAISLSETVMHPGHYRFALSINSRAEIPPDPTVVVVGGLSDTAAIENPPVFPVLADDVFDHTTGIAPISWTTSLVLPNITCAKCTLQVIEFMAEHTPNVGGGYFYHHCADLQITADPSLPLADAGVPTADASGRGGSGGSGGADGGSDVAVVNGGGQAAGGRAGAGGVASGGSVTSGGASGAGGALGGATSGTSGGASSGGGSVASGGAKTSAGGSAGTSAGAGGSTGTIATGGSAVSGGGTSVYGTATGGSARTSGGSLSASGGVPSTASGGSTGTVQPSSGSSGCAVARSTSVTPGALAFALAALAVSRLRRRRKAHALNA
jgi:hypothetical protein